MRKNQDKHRDLVMLQQQLLYGLFHFYLFIFFHKVLPDSRFDRKTKLFVTTTIVKVFFFTGRLLNTVIGG